jgi:hypothetical protein
MHSTDSYDESRELEAYLTRNRWQLMTDFERLAKEIYIKRENGNLAIADGREPQWTRDALARYAGKHWGKILAVIGESPESFRAFEDGVTQRIRVELMKGALLNRCPKCCRIVKTPAAAQCLWCNHDWHSA